MVAPARTLARSNDNKKRVRRQAEEKQRQPQAPADPRAIVARQYMRMSEAHDRIRMKVLSDSLLRQRSF